MPNYKGRFGHRNQTIALASLLLAVPALTWNLQDLAFSGGALIGLKLSPDLDIQRDWGWFARLGLVDEYARLIPHRSKWSHWPVLGTLIRAIVIMGPLLLIASFFVRLPWDIILRLLGGWMLADTLHYVTDRTQTWFKQLMRT